MVRGDYPIKGNYKKGKIEGGFQKELFSFLEKDGYICYHIPDTTYEYRLLDGICVSPTGTIFFLELKKIELYTFNMSQFEGSQIAFMQALQKRGVESYIGIYSQKNNEYVILTYSKLCEMINDKGGAKLFNK